MANGRWRGPTVPNANSQRGALDGNGDVRKMVYLATGINHTMLPS